VIVDIAFEMLLPHHDRVTTLALYHVLPANLVGSHLLPLNQLRSLYPDVASVAMRRYQGREKLLQRQIPQLGCKWSDTVSLSLTSPETLRSLAKELGLPWKPRIWVAIDPHTLDSGHSILYPSRRRTPWSPDTSQDFEPYRIENLASYQSVELTREDWAQAKSNGTPMLLFSSVPSVLYRGNIDITNLSRFEQ